MPKNLHQTASNLKTSTNLQKPHAFGCSLGSPCFWRRRVCFWWCLETWIFWATRKICRRFWPAKTIARRFEGPLWVGHRWMVRSQRGGWLPLLLKDDLRTQSRWWFIPWSKEIFLLQMPCSLLLQPPTRGWPLLFAARDFGRGYVYKILVHSFTTKLKARVKEGSLSLGPKRSDSSGTKKRWKKFPDFHPPKTCLYQKKGFWWLFGGPG